MRVWFDIFPNILAYLPPPKVAQMRLVNKKMCALISAGPFAQKYWGKDYLDFRRDICSVDISKRKLFLNGTWSGEMFYKILNMIRDSRNGEDKIVVLKRHGFDCQVGSVQWIVLLFFQCPNFSIGLVEGLFTLNDINANISILWYRELLNSKYGMKLLRKKYIRLDILLFFLNHYDVRQFFNDENTFNDFKTGRVEYTSEGFNFN